MSQKPIIAVDADDTIFDENTAVRLFHNAAYFTKHTAEDYQAPGIFGTFWDHIWHTEPTETLRRYEEFIAHKLKHNLPPIPGALEVLTELKQHFELVIITARDKRGVAMTHEALTEHFGDIFKDVHFVPLWRTDRLVTKADICNDIGASYLIDDSYENCELAASGGIEALLFGIYGWNRTQPLKSHMTRVKDWAAVREYFDGQR